MAYNHDHLRFSGHRRMVKRVGLLPATRREVLQRIKDNPTKKRGEASGGRKAGAQSVKVQPDTKGSSSIAAHICCVCPEKSVAGGKTGQQTAGVE